MEGIFTIVIVFFLINAALRFFKKVSQSAQNKQTQTQAQTEATRPMPKPAPRRDDFRFPSAIKAQLAPVFQEGGDPSAIMSTYTPISPSKDLSDYTPIKPSMDLDSQFSDYEGSLDVDSTEGIGYQADAYDAVPAQYSTDANNVAKLLPETFNRDALLQAVVMSEILKRPGAQR